MTAEEVYDKVAELQNKIKALQFSGHQTLGDCFTIDYLYDQQVDIVKNSDLPEVLKERYREFFDDPCNYLEKKGVYTDIHYYDD